MRKPIMILIFIISVSMVFTFLKLIEAQEEELKRGISMVEEGKLDEAIDQFLRIAEKSPNFEFVYINLGAAYYQKGKIDKAIEAYKKAIEINPNNKFSRRYLGNTYSDVKKYDEAIIEHRKAVELDPNDENSIVDLGVALSRKGDIEEGISNFKKAISINPYNPMARFNLGNSYYTLKKWPEALEEYIYARDLYYSPSQGVESGLKLTLDKAFSDLKKMEEDKPSEPEVHYYLAYAYAFKGKWKDAMKETELALKLNPSRGDFYKAKAWFLINEKKYQEAIDACKKGVEMDPTNWTCYIPLSLGYNQMGKPTEALDIILKAADANPNIMRIHVRLGEAYAINKEPEKALAAFQKAISLGGSGDPTIYFNIFGCYFSLNNLQMAMEYLNKAARMGSPQAKELIKKIKKGK